MTVRVIALALVLSGLPMVAAAQGNFEIQVYPSETTTPGTTMFELHTTSALRGTTRSEDGVRPTRYAVHETLEITGLDELVRGRLLSLHEYPA
jgi:hypothetical protein